MTVAKLLFTTKVTLIQGTHNSQMSASGRLMLLFTTKVTLIQGTHNLERQAAHFPHVVVHHEGNSYSRNSQLSYTPITGTGCCCSPRR